jgi:hypothetical protein
MRLTSRALAALLGAFVLVMTAASQTPAPAADKSGRDASAPPAASSPPAAQQPQQPVCGWELMTEQERADFRTKMRSLKTPEEQAQFRAEHHEQMKARAKERGVTLPDDPRSGCGKGAGGVRGPGPGPGPAPRPGIPDGSS